MASKNCEGCGVLMEGVSNRRTTCSQACRQRVHKARQNNRPVHKVDEADWPSPFAATLASLSLAQRAKLRAAIAREPKLAAQAQIPVGVDPALIDMPPALLRAELGPLASLKPYGWPDGAALHDFIAQLEDDDAES